VPRRWKALIIWIAVPYAFGTLILTFIEALSVNRLAYWWNWSFNLRQLAANLLFCAVQGSLGTLGLWLLPIRRFWIGTIAGGVFAAGFIVGAAKLAMLFYGGFEENIGIVLAAFNFLLPSCCAGVIAGFLRFKDGQVPAAVTPSESAGHLGAGLFHRERRYIRIMLSVIVGIWIALLFRILKWW